MTHRLYACQLAKYPLSMVEYRGHVMQLSRLPDNFEIAPGYTVEAWKKLILDEAPHNTEDWNTAVKILETRIRSRFLTPAQFLIDSDSDKGRRTNGFAILAIDFLVIETIQGFRTGQISHRAQSKKLFQAFLAGWEAFTACVPEGMDANALAAMFMNRAAVRCTIAGRQTASS